MDSLDVAFIQRTIPIWRVRRFAQKLCLIAISPTASGQRSNKAQTVGVTTDLVITRHYTPFKRGLYVKSSCFLKAIA